MKNDKEIACLERFLIDNHKFEKLNAELSGFNIFEAVGAVKQELRHSDFLAFIINPNANHGIGDEFLARILIDILTQIQTKSIRPIDLQLASLENTEIRREWRNIDLLVILNELKLVIAIENKVDSSESKNQLKKYSSTLKNSFSDEYTIIKVFLTPDGISAIYDKSWDTYSYQRIAEQLEKFLADKSEEIAPKIDQLLTDYLTLLRRHIVPDERLVELCRKIYREHSNALDLIFEHKMDVYSEIKSELIDLINSDPDVELDLTNKTYIRFSPKSWDRINEMDKGGGWTPSNKILLYEFQNSNNLLRLKLIIGPGEHEVRMKIHELYMANKKTFKQGRTKLSNQYSQILRLDVLSKAQYEDHDIDDMKNKVRKFWKNFKENQFKEINKLVLKEFKVE